MADEELVEKIRAADNVWADVPGNESISIHLENAELEGIDMQNAHLVNADFRRADLRRAKMYGANLNGARLEEADLSEAMLKDAWLQKVVLYGAILSRADLRNAKMNGAHLAEALLRNADLRGADLSGAGLDGAELEGAMVSNGTNIMLPDEWAVRQGRITYAHGSRAHYEVKLDESVVGRDENLLDLSSETSPSAGGAFSTGFSSGFDLGTKGEVATSAFLGTSDPTVSERETLVRLVQQRIGDEPAEVAEHLTLLAATFGSQAEFWRSKRPNQPDEDWENQMAFLEETQARMEALAQSVHALEHEQTEEQVVQAAEEAVSLRSALVTWWNENNQTVINMAYGAVVVGAAAGATYGLSALLGVGANLAFAVSATALGGKPLIDAAKGLLPGKKDDQSEDE